MRKYISIEGIIGAGKTTLAKHLAQEIQAHLVLENFENNPHLSKFYESPEEAAMQTELFFLDERIHHLKRELNNTQNVVSDYIFNKSLWFASQTLTPENFLEFKTVFNQFQTSIPKPSHLIFIEYPPEQALISIKERGRLMEQNIDLNYLTLINNVYNREISALSPQINVLKISGEALRINLKSQMFKIIEFLA